jgi:hypothetical protein
MMLASALRSAVQEESPERLTEFTKAAAGEMISISMGFGGLPGKPIKAFIEPRQKSVRDQLTGKTEGQTISSGFGGGGRRP